MIQGGVTGTERGAAVGLEGKDSFPSMEELLEDNPVTTSNQGLEWPKEASYDKGQTNGINTARDHGTITKNLKAGGGKPQDEQGKVE